MAERERLSSCLQCDQISELAAAGPVWGAEQAPRTLPTPPGVKAWLLCSLVLPDRHRPPGRPGSGSVGTGSLRPQARGPWANNGHAVRASGMTSPPQSFLLQAVAQSPLCVSVSARGTVWGAAPSKGAALPRDTRSTVSSPHPLLAKGHRKGEVRWRGASLDPSKWCQWEPIPGTAAQTKGSPPFNCLG
ncbi:hypothetical protein KIL84_020424 [Mauremys mutica]|uniref:Uncharacterized protein n=1 Tax=Mauremys mutica TaxID=74926 RepID=A0A9D3XYT1_9SAUR|nr:hypothetical protein KIL84_020424 [Mauremys mutica]